MALLRVRAVLDPSPKDVAITVAHRLDLQQPVTVDCQETTQNSCLHQLPVASCVSVTKVSAGSTQTHVRDVSQSFNPSGSINIGLPRSLHQNIEHDLCLKQPLDAVIEKTASQGCITQLCLQSCTDSTLVTGSGNQIFTQAVQSFVPFQQVTGSQKFFLTVLSNADFELIVDEIWANMKKDNKGWKNKNELRAGLLAFMQSLPGN